MNSGHGNDSVTLANSESILMQHVAAGDTEALGKLYDTYAAGIFSLVMRMAGSQTAAEEITQETFIRAWRQAATFEAGRGSLRVWILRIARNLAIDDLRRRAARPQVTDEDDTIERVEAADAGPEESAAQAQQRDAVTLALAHLPDAQRQVVYLAYYGGLSQSEIAHRLGEPLGTVKTRMRLALQKLKGELGDEAGTR